MVADTSWLSGQRITLLRARTAGTPTAHRECAELSWRLAAEGYLTGVLTAVSGSQDKPEGTCRTRITCSVGYGVCSCVLGDLPAVAAADNE